VPEVLDSGIAAPREQKLGNCCNTEHTAYLRGYPMGELGLPSLPSDSASTALSSCKHVVHAASAAALSLVHSTTSICLLVWCPAALKDTFRLLAVC
jgi:hypothetical protein